MSPYVALSLVIAVTCIVILYFVDKKYPMEGLAMVGDVRFYLMFTLGVIPVAIITSLLLEALRSFLVS